MKMKTKLLILIAIPTLFLVACSDDGGVINGAGDNHTTDAGINPVTPVNPIVDYVPKHCADLGYTPAEVPKLVGCSYDSYLNCKCWDPTPGSGQNSTLVK